jgi:hypothetical protein
MKSEILTAVKMLMLVFWVITPCGLVGRYQRFCRAEGGDSRPMFLRNVGISPQVHTALKPRRTTSTILGNIFHGIGYTNFEMRYLLFYNLYFIGLYVYLWQTQNYCKDNDSMDNTLHRTIKFLFEKKRCDGVDYIKLPQVQCRPLVNTVMKVQIPLEARNFLMTLLSASK